MSSDSNRSFHSQTPLAFSTRCVSTSNLCSEIRICSFWYLPGRDKSANLGISVPLTTSAMILYTRDGGRSEEHTSELQSIMRISYAVFCLKKKKSTNQHK